MLICSMIFRETQPQNGIINSMGTLILYFEMDVLTHYTVFLNRKHLNNTVFLACSLFIVR